MIYAVDNTIIIKSGKNMEYRIYNVAGQLVKQGKSTGETTSVFGMEAGVYLVKSVTDTSDFIKKIIINH
ncbi:MAG: T9SS type A sorting domain-containing protein [Dysgonamonadaceae bacterium]|nr:T9SS type A sorting domain-containing protein [Dysgonamonadaceae bacterium]